MPLTLLPKKKPMPLLLQAMTPEELQRAMSLLQSLLPLMPLPLRAPLPMNMEFELETEPELLSEDSAAARSARTGSLYDMDTTLLPPPLLMMVINMVGMLNEVVALNPEGMPRAMAPGWIMRLEPSKVVVIILLSSLGRMLPLRVPPPLSLLRADKPQPVHRLALEGILLGKPPMPLSTLRYDYRCCWLYSR